MKATCQENYCNPIPNRQRFPKGIIQNGQNIPQTKLNIRPVGSHSQSRPVNISWENTDVNSLAQKTSANTYTINDGIPNYWCNSQHPIGVNDPNYISPNQQLVQGQNKFTKIPPVVVPPTHDLSYWKANDLIVHSLTNDISQIDNYLSGYAVSTCCGNLAGKTVVPQPTTFPAVSGIPNYTNLVDGALDDIIEPFQSPKPVDVTPYIPSIPVQNQRENFNSPKPVDVTPYVPEIPVQRENFQSPKPVDVTPYVPSIPVQENFTNTTNTTNSNDGLVAPNQSGWVNTTCGYNPSQLFKAGLPTNFPAGNCEQEPALKQYNTNLFTQTIQPNVYTRTEVNEPVNSNIGISFQQQFEPVSCKMDGDNLTYTQEDPRLIRPSSFTPNLAVIEPATQANIYDPRFSGYGTSYRSYTDPTTGQTRFAYDDVNAIRMPNYITRSNIDFLPYADSYGPIQPDRELGNPLTADIRGLAQDSWLRSSLQFRNDLMERQMRKANAINWQRRMAPINTYGSCRSSGGSA